MSFLGSGKAPAYTPPPEPKPERDDIDASKLAQQRLILARLRKGRASLVIDPATATANSGLSIASQGGSS